MTPHAAVIGGQDAKNAPPGPRRPRPWRYQHRDAFGQDGARGMAVVLNLALIGLAITLDPLPLTAFIAVLSSKRGVTKGAAFVFGWLLSLAIVVTVTVLATGDNPPEPSTAPPLAGLAAKVAIGVVLVTIAIRHIWAWGRPKPPKKPPKWQEHVDGMSPWFALGLAPGLQPWALIGADAVVEAKLSSWESYLALFGFCLRASASYLFTEIYTVFKPGQSQALLVGFRTWIDTHTDQVIISGSLLLAHRQQPLPDPHLRHHRSPWN